MKIYRILKSYRKSQDINIDELNNLMKINNQSILLDVRSPQEYKEVHLNRSA